MSDIVGPGVIVESRHITRSGVNETSACLMTERRNGLHHSSLNVMAGHAHEVKDRCAAGERRSPSKDIGPRSEFDLSRTRRRSRSADQQKGAGDHSVVGRQSTVIDPGRQVGGIPTDCMFSGRDGPVHQDGDLLAGHVVDG